MEELSFFNEREAECFEREDTLSLSDLEKLNVDENMPEMERVEKLLKTGLDKQKISIFNTIPKILANNNSKENLSLLLNCMKEVWQKYESELNANSAVLSELFRALASLSCTTVDGKALRFPKVTFHEEYAQQLEACLEEKKNAVFLLSEEQVIKLLVPFALDIIAEIQQKDQAEEASLALVALLPRVGTAIKKTQILRLAMEKGDVSQTPGSRLICCFVLGAVTALNLVAAPDIEGLYFQKMMSLCQDTDAEVRKCMCIQLDGLARAIGEDFARKELLSELLELLKDEEEQVKQAAFMTLLSLVDFFSPRDCIKQIIPELICIAESIPAYLVPCLAERYGQLVTRLCYHEEFETRQFCAYNFPAIVKVFGSAYASMLMDDLLLRLASDSSDEVRQHIAAGMHEVAVLIGQQQAMRYLKESALNLINDNSPIVQGMAISKLPSLLSAMIDPGDEEQKTLIMELVIKSVIEYHAILPSSRNREQLVLLETLQNFRPWISATQSYEMVVPIILALLENGARPVQVLALKVLLKYIRNDNNVSHRTSLLSRLRTEYVDFIVSAIFSSYLPDRKFVDRIGQFLDESKTDRDRDVANTLQEIRQAVEANNCGHKRRLQDDIDDKRKLSEEELLGLMKDHEESLVDSRWSTMLEYTLFVGTDGQVNRRARVKSFDLVNKFVKLPGKDTGRNAMNVNGNIGGVYNIGSKPDPTKIKASSAKALNKAAPSATTLPNCASARAGLAKMPLAAKVTNLGRSITVGTRSNTGLIRAGVGLSKDTGGITKIPIIRPSAPAKREASPSTSLKPTSATMVPTSGLSSRSGSIDCGVGPTKPQKNVDDMREGSMFWLGFSGNSSLPK
ncbi:Protein phosphatase 2A regulatory subunit A and related proteins [Plasmopara halstedii]|uniref:Protein phosphatase 2A regulatory subunit A and related proteins n=1 Tax=Plasmopara halstedii TaxID=4781 RepID=A0A0N7L632_PLAHL|nr:Protein phosphatase 2A regulatory subunit A and related proteins [Plasmopara halstedii]CEG43147.1 Protein phosphatase 2A regulatory subunit A and related proteins [Plasmopara halstedii]|eukprot:XP_024579516.1 Protein phosphatase 2A regulatory subunit A and related proteins [Plasmopara halstedii]